MEPQRNVGFKNINVPVIGMPEGEEKKKKKSIQNIQRQNG